MQVVLDQVSLLRPQQADITAPILSTLNLQIQAGEQLALIGPSGAGKTSLLHLLACAAKPASGDFRLFGQAPWTLTQRARHRLRKQLFLAPQTPPLPARQRVVTAVSAALLNRWNTWQSLRNLFAPVAAQAVWEALAKFDLQDKLYERVDRLSGGERQRCALARTVLSHAELLLIDEPLSALDPTLAQHTLHVLQDTAASNQATLICSLHQVDLALAHFPRVIGLRAGKIVFDCAPPQIDASMLAALYENAAVMPDQTVTTRITVKPAC